MMQVIQTTVHLAIIESPSPFLNQAENECLGPSHSRFIQADIEMAASMTEFAEITQEPADFRVHKCVRR